MRADVTTLGFTTGPGSASPAPSSPVAPYDALAATPAGDHLVLAWLPGIAGGARALATAKALVGRSDLAVVTVEAPGRTDATPLTSAVAVATVLLTAPEHVPLAALAALAGETSRTLRSWTVLGSVAGLTHPSPSLWQHALSWVPGTRFTVDLSAGRVSLGRTPPAAAPLETAEPGSAPHAWAAHTGSAAGPWGEHLLAQLGVRAHDASGWGAPVRGARPSAEVSVLPVPAWQLLAAPSVVDVEPCRGCSRPAPAGTCPFCGHHRTAAPTSTQELPA